MKGDPNLWAKGEGGRRLGGRTETILTSVVSRGTDPDNLCHEEKKRGVRGT